MEKRKMLYISQEIAPYVAADPRAVRARLLPQGIQERGFEVRNFMPKYGCINERRNQLHEVIRLSGMNLIIDDTDHPLIIKVATLQPSRMQVYFIDNDDYFGHNATKELEPYVSPDDNDERLIFFSRGVVETVKKLRWAPEIIHCSGWVSALSPLFLKKKYNDDPSLKSAKVVISISHADDMPKPLDARLLDKLRSEGFENDDIAVLGEGEASYNDLIRLAMKYSDGIIVAEPDADQTLVEEALASGKPVLISVKQDDDPANVDAETINRYIEFYDSLK